MSLDDVLAELRRTYLDALPARADLIEQLLANQKYDEVETEFHKLKGTGRTYGLPEVTAIGEITERLVEHGKASAEKSVPTALNALRKVRTARDAGAPLDLASDPDFLQLSEMARNIRDVDSDQAKNK